MTALPSPNRAAEIREKIHAFIKKKLGDQDVSGDRLAGWLALTAKRAKALQQATHIVKGIHSGANGTNVRALPKPLPDCEELGTHSLGANLEFDVAIPGAREAGVYPFLQMDIGGMSLLEALRNDDTDALHALHDDEAEARQLRADLLSLLYPKQTPPASHAYAKQIYWCVDEDPEQGFIYHLLAPLYPSSLVHEVYKTIEAASGEANKPARDARRNKKYHTGAVHVYPSLVVHHIVASNPQNVSSVMKKQGGKAYLLSSAPPHWKSSKVRIPYRCKTVFDRIYGGRPAVRAALSELLDFLLENPPQQWEVRRKREHYVSSLIGELMQMSAEYRQGLTAGWSRSPEVRLREDECCWLDPYRVCIPEESEFRKSWIEMEWVDEVRARFAHWLNEQLDDLPVGDVEYHKWKRELLKTDIVGTWARELYKELTGSLYQPVEEVLL